MPLSTRKALDYLEKQHGIVLTQDGLRVHVRKGHIPLPEELRDGRRMFFTKTILNRFAKTKRHPGNPNWVRPAR